MWPFMFKRYSLEVCDCTELFLFIITWQILKYMVYGYLQPSWLFCWPWSWNLFCCLLIFREWKSKVQDIRWWVVCWRDYIGTWSYCPWLWYISLLESTPSTNSLNGWLASHKTSSWILNSRCVCLQFLECEPWLLMNDFKPDFIFDLAL